MKLSLFDYNLPKELIAKRPVTPRDAARLFVYHRLNKKSVHPVRDPLGVERIPSSKPDKISNGVHTKFNQIGRFLKKGDVLVLNNTKVLPARLEARIKHTDSLGRKFKILLLEKKSRDVWGALIDGKKRKQGQELYFHQNLSGKILKKLDDGQWEIQFSLQGKKLDNLIFSLGQMPLPPYIKQKKYFKKNKYWYQTVFARVSGSVAAPTAGLHFSRRLLKKLKKQGIKIEYITLYIGLGTFLPVKQPIIEKHKMQRELAIVSAKTARRLNKEKKKGHKIIACGTTVVRTLESFVAGRKVVPGKRYIDLFIYPPYKFKIVDALITNFHLPKSSLLMLAAAFLDEGKTSGIKRIKELYQEAIKKKYQFYSYGDAMLIV